MNMKTSYIMSVVVALGVGGFVLAADLRIGVGPGGKISVPADGGKVSVIDNSTYKHMVKWLPFDRSEATPTDLSSYHVNGTVTDASWSNEFGGFFFCDGSSAFIDTATNLTGATDYTIAIDVLTGDWNPNTVRFYGCRYLTTGGVGMNQPSNCRFFARYPGGALLLESFVDMTDASWHQYVVTGESAVSNRSIYIDGILVKEQEHAYIAAGGLTDQSTYPIYIGADNDDGSAVTFAKGYYDNFRAWRTNLSSNEVYQEYLRTHK